tara:strand:+ start:39 stop:926 length:888 start_codon:yes stop_codon:yes gene_type:complete
VPTVLRTTKECRNVYRDILQGYSFVSEQAFYIKHYKEADLGFLESVYQSFSKKASVMGLLSREDKLKLLNEEDYWTTSEEENYISLSLAVNDAKEHYNKLVIPAQIEAFKEIMEEQEGNLREVAKTRNEIVEPTIESYCDKLINELYVFHAIYKDPELKTSFFTQEEFDNLSYRELGEVVTVYNNAISMFTEENIKKIGVNSFFLNAFLMVDNDPVKFFGKSVLELTVYQMNLFSKGKYYKSILMEGSEPPTEYYDDEKEGVASLVKWFDTEHARMMTKRAADAAKAKQRSMGRR